MIRTHAGLPIRSNVRRDQSATIVLGPHKLPRPRISARPAQIIVRHRMSPRGARTHRSGHRQPRKRHTITASLNASALLRRQCPHANQRPHRASIRRLSGNTLRPRRPNEITLRLHKVFRHRLRTPRLLLPRHHRPPDPTVNRDRNPGTARDDRIDPDFFSPTLGQTAGPTPCLRFAQPRDRPSAGPTHRSVIASIIRNVRPDCRIRLSALGQRAPPVSLHSARFNQPVSPDAAPLRAVEPGGRSVSLRQDSGLCSLVWAFHRPLFAPGTCRICSPIV